MQVRFQAIAVFYAYKFLKDAIIIWPRAQKKWFCLLAFNSLAEQIA